jgi:hypothetical protein
MAITLEQAKSLKLGTILYHVENRNADNSPQRWIVNGKPKTWKNGPSRVQVPMKNGMWNYGYLTEADLESVCLNEEEACGSIDHQ